MADQRTRIYPNHTVWGGGNVVPNSMVGSTLNFLTTGNVYATVNEIRDQMSIFDRVRKPTKPKQTDVATARDRVAEALADYIAENHADRDVDLSDVLRSFSYDVAMLERQEATKKAEETLIEHLDEKQRKQWKNNRYFNVAGKTMTYQLTESYRTGGVVKVVKGPNKGVWFCVYTTDKRAPKCDELLGYKFSIEASEAEFLKTANPKADASWYLDPDGKRIERYPERNRNRNLFIGGAETFYQTYRQFMDQADQLQRRLEQQQNILQTLQTTIPNTTWTLTQNRDFVDATTFGDLNQAYLAGAITPTLTGRNLDGVLTFRERPGRTPQATFEPAATGRMANHPAGPLDANHCADCSRVQSQLDQMQAAWTQP